MSSALSTPEARDAAMTPTEALDALVETVEWRKDAVIEWSECNGPECRQFYRDVMDRHDQAIATYRQIILAALTGEDGE